MLIDPISIAIFGLCIISGLTIAKAFGIHIS